MKLFVTSIYVDDQEKALQFYTQKLGFVKKDDISANGYRWLTVASPEAPDGVQLVLEPNTNPAASTYQRAMLEQGIPAILFQVENLDAEYKRLTDLRVEFRQAPQDLGPTKIAQLPDTCGNLVQLNQPVRQ